MNDIPLCYNVAMKKGQKKGQLQTHCNRGHEFTPENTMVRKRDRGRGAEISRTCRKCHSLAGLRYRAGGTYDKAYRNQYAKVWRTANIDKVVAARLKAQYGITLAEYAEMLDKQSGKCLICDRTSKKKLVVDHCHDKGHIRGLLCASCNMRLGWFETNKDRINNYLD